MIHPLRRRGGAAAPALIALTAAAASVALAACGGEPVNQAGTPSAPTVSPNACRLLTPASVREALTLPPPASASASPQTAAPEPTPSGVYAVRPVSIGGRVNVPNAGTCTYASPSGDQLVVAVLPKTTVAAVQAAQPGAASLAAAAVVSSATASLVAVQAGTTTVELTLDLGGSDAATRANRLAALASQVTLVSLPTLSAQAQAPASGGTASASATPVPSVGTVVTGQPPAQSVAEVDQLKFQPPAVSLKAGDAVQWTNSGTVAHNVTFDAYPEITSGTLNGGDKYEVKFTQAGTYAYHCTFHAGMDGQVTVG